MFQCIYNCIVVAAGNSKDESDSAYNMTEPLFRRFHGHIYLPLDISSFLEWGSELREGENIPNIHPMISAFLSTYPKLLYSEYNAEKEGPNFAIDPRAWKQVSDILYYNKGSISKELLTNTIGEDTTKMLIEFAQKNFITIEDILENNYNIEDIPTRIDEQYALVLSLRHANEFEIEKVREFVAQNLSGETLAKFDYIWVSNKPERAMILSELKEKQKETTSEASQESTSNKITIQEFCGSINDWHKPHPYRQDKMSILCKTKGQAQLLFIALNRLNRFWYGGTIYNIKDTHFEEGIYYSNIGTYAKKDIFSDFKIIDFEDIDFNGIINESDYDFIKKEQIKTEAKDYRFKPQLKRFQKYNKDHNI